MSRTRISTEWENERKTMIRITYPAGYTTKDYLNMLAVVLAMIEGNSATIVYINHFQEGAEMLAGDMVSAVNRMTKTFKVDAMILWHETDLSEIYNRAIVKSFGFEQGKNVWYVRSEASALKLAYELNKNLNPQVNRESKEQPKTMSNNSSAEENLTDYE